MLISTLYEPEPSRLMALPRSMLICYVDCYGYCLSLCLCCKISLVNKFQVWRFLYTVIIAHMHIYIYIYICINKVVGQMWLFLMLYWLFPKAIHSTFYCELMSDKSFMFFFFEALKHFVLDQWLTLYYRVFNSSSHQRHILCLSLNWLLNIIL